MKLLKLHLAGFKTFADKTEIDFGDGLTAVVGPNGCGKSNVADALLWVMGEQNPRLLRGSDSRDFIFSGTDKRKPLGMAEVRLLLDNSDSSLPIDFCEVSIARRVYRSGESHYYLNHAPCRLKDIVELFMDSGMGKGAYSFVGQSEVDTVLSARPEDRRELFEEAAGIKKYRHRKREAMRKLDQAEANLTRIRDIVHELDQQRGPLERQAQVAARYLNLSERLRTIEIGMLVSDAQRSDYELYAAKRDRELDIQAVQEFDAQLARLEREAETVRGQLGEAEKEADAARRDQQSAITSSERIENQMQLALERARGAERTTEVVDSELHDLAVRIAELEKDGATHHASLASVDEEVRTLGQALQAARAKLDELEKALSEARQRGSDRQGALRRLADQRAQREASLAASRERVADTAMRMAANESDRSANAEECRLAGERLIELEARQCAMQASESSLASGREERETDTRLLLESDARARSGVDVARRQLAELESRLATLIELQESGEGFYQGVRAVLQAVRGGSLAGQYAPVVDLLGVRADLRVAVEVGLGASAQDVVCDTETDAQEAIDYLKTTRSGRATFLALTLVRPVRPLSVSSTRGLPGIVGIAADLVTFDARYEPVMSMLLGRVIVVEDMDSALQARRVDGWNRIVTLSGELLAPSGALTGGSLQGRGALLVGRKGEIDDLKDALPALVDRVTRAAQTIEGNAERLNGLNAEIARLSDELSATQAQVAAHAAELTACRRDVSRLQAAAADLASEFRRLQDNHDSVSRELAEWEALVKRGKAEDTSLDDEVSSAIASAERLAVQVVDARAAATSLQVEVGRVTEKRTGLRRAAQTTDHLLGQARAQQNQKRNQRENAAGQYAAAGVSHEELAAALSVARIHLSECDALHTDWNAKRQALLQESFERASAIKTVGKQRSDTTQEVHDAELRIARLEVKQAQTAQRLLDDYSMTLEEVLTQPDPGEPERDIVNEIARLRRELRGMGQVNTGAVEEYDRLTERHDFLAGQRADLEQARTSLLATIAEIDENTRGIFMETFSQVSEEFQRLFVRLFGGGSTKLVLTDPNDLLETGIDVIAQPPGKRAQNLALLSGGERALTAVALLFSFLRVRPSPFVLLDEVDAPLDGANVEKFVDLVRDLCSDTQFLVITHNPTTMESAPRWYGVTMHEPGVSRVISYRVPEESVLSEPDKPLMPVAVSGA